MPIPAPKIVGQPVPEAGSEGAPVGVGVAVAPGAFVGVGVGVAVAPGTGVGDAVGVGVAAGEAAAIVKENTVQALGGSAAAGLEVGAVGATDSVLSW